ncbi:alpha/beta hydrolase [Maritimibacter sp. 55A14]|uniref:alpha/beta fold hydrolase n=1 Tax=Maritimibacter sp. 55A14 TaxID=2174844 RepID=UPI000D6108B1|nr:alpha/beta hydrolase [Maritimibacter sp. 55A14]PWE33735.1 alpha/beta hydrolase [Maritimibacter sp. 55A14]
MEPAPLFEDVADAPEGGTAWWLTADDGVRLRAAIWRDSAREAPNGTIIIFPGRTEFIEKYGRAAGDLRARGFDCAAVDWRGQGLADRLLADAGAGHVEDFADYQRDVAVFLELLDAQEMPQPWYLVGHSMGGCIGLRALHEGMPVRAAAFTGPMWKIAMAAPLRPVARALSRVSRPLGFGHLYAPGTEGQNYVFTAPFEDNTLTTDRDMWDYMSRQMAEHPELAIGGPSLHWLSEALREKVAVTSLPQPDLPILVMVGSEERIVDRAAVEEIARSWPNARMEVLEGGQHEIMMETPAIRGLCFDTMAEFFKGHR